LTFLSVASRSESMQVQTTKPAMNLAALRFDRTAALIDGRVAVENLNVINTPGGKASVSGFYGGAFDAADIPLARYVSWKVHGVPVTAIPVFTDRLFQYAYIYTRTDTGITKLDDLRGRRVICAPSYFATPSFWFRALLKDECGIEPHEIEWYSTTPESAEMHIPDGIRVTVSPASILGLERLLDGTADCLMTARTPLIPDEQRHVVRRVLLDAHEHQRAWYERNKFFPILHVVAIRQDALSMRPGFATELCRAYDEAKDHAYRVLQDERMTGLPFMRTYLDDTVELCGDDPWPYGLDRNQAELKRFLSYAHEQGLTNRDLEVEELFESDAASYKFTARMFAGCITAMPDGGWAPSRTRPNKSGQRRS
jgi:4,5-dihydroxyphthalate decarboxylase